MSKIDSHQHFWVFDSDRESWITEDMQVIRRDFLPEDLKPLLDEAGIEGCVAVQADQSLKENQFLCNLAVNNPFIRAVVGWVDLQSTTLEEDLIELKQNQKLKGFRHVLQAEQRRDLMLQSEFISGIKQLGKMDFTYDILIHADQLKYVPELLSGCPDQLFVLDHIAKPDIKGGNIKDWAQEIQQLSSFENLYCKMSGMVTEADLQNWQVSDFEPYMDVVFNAFGSNRIMFGSDWPVCLLGASYPEVISIVETYILKLSTDEQAAFWGSNASKFYQIN